MFKEHHYARLEKGQVRVYPPELRNLLQSLLATLADIDFAHDSELEKVQSSVTDEELKGRVIETLRRRHQERRTPYVRQLASLQSRIDQLFD